MELVNKTSRYKETTSPSPSWKWNLKNNNVNIENINPKIIEYLNTLEPEYQKLILATSGNDSKHSLNSAHYSNDAVDLRIHENTNPYNDRLYQRIAKDPKRLEYGVALIDPKHGDAPHLHLSVGRENEIKSDVFYKYYSNSNEVEGYSGYRGGYTIPTSEDEYSSRHGVNQETDHNHNEEYSVGNPSIESMFLRDVKLFTQQVPITTSIEEKTNDSDESNANVEAIKGRLIQKSNDRAFLMGLIEDTNLDFVEYNLEGTLPPQQQTKQSMFEDGGEVDLLFEKFLKGGEKGADENTKASILDRYPESFNRYTYNDSDNTSIASTNMYSKLDRDSQYKDRFSSADVINTREGMFEPNVLSSDNTRVDTGRIERRVANAVTPKSITSNAELSSTELNSTELNSNQQQGSQKRGLNGLVAETQLTNLSREEVQTVQKELFENGYYSDAPVNMYELKGKEDVKKVQKFLLERGYNLGEYGTNKDGIDGVIGALTTRAIKDYNSSVSSPMDGVLGKKTIEAFRNYQRDKGMFAADVDLPLPNSDKDILASQRKLYENGYFKLTENDFNFDNYNIKSETVSSSVPNFKINPKTKCTTTECSKYIREELATIVGTPEAERVGLGADAWMITSKLVNSGAKEVYSVFEDERPPDLKNPDSYLDKLTKNAQPLDVNQVKSGDIVTIYYGGSSSTQKAYDSGSKEFSTHAGVVKVDDSGNKYVEHNVGGRVIKNRLEDMATDKVRNSNGRPVRITGIVRPSYKELGAVTHYSPTRYGVNWSKTTNLLTSFASQEGARFTQTLLNNEEKLISDTPVTNTEFGALVRAATVVGWKESNFSPNPKTQDLGLNLQSLDKITRNIGGEFREFVGQREMSRGYTQLKDEENFIPEVRAQLNITDNNLKEVGHSAIATYYSLATKYSIIRDAVKEAGKSYTPDDITQLALISWNEPIHKVTETALKYNSIDEVVNAYKEAYSIGGKEFPYGLAIEAYRDYIK